MNDKITTLDGSTTNAVAPDPICYKTDKAYKRVNTLSAEQSIAIHLLLAGQTDQQVADTVKVHRTTLTRWRLYHPLFQAELNRQRQALWHNQADRLRSLLAPALDVLQMHLHSASERSSFRAAVSLVRLAIKLGTPTGPTDEYLLLKDYYLADWRDQKKHEDHLQWPVPKDYLDDVRDYLHKKSAGIPFQIDQDCAQNHREGLENARYDAKHQSGNP
jgi:hypothetical protein